MGTKGGVQSLQQKMNMADDLYSDEASSRTEKGDEKELELPEPVAATPVKNTPDESGENPFSNSSALAVPEIQTSLDVSIRSSHGLLLNQSPMNSVGGTPSHTDKQDNNLPEDREIIDEEEEEEEDV